MKILDYLIFNLNDIFKLFEIINKSNLKLFNVLLK